MKLTTEKLLSYDAKIKRLLDPEISEINEDEITEIIKYIVENSLPLDTTPFESNISVSGSSKSMSAAGVGNVSMESEKNHEWKNYNPSKQLVRFGKYKFKHEIEEDYNCGSLDIQHYFTSISSDAKLDTYKLCFNLENHKPLALFVFKKNISFKVPFAKLYCTLFATSLLKGNWKYKRRALHITSSPY
jgi:hypothetical protein